MAGTRELPENVREIHPRLIRAYDQALSMAYQQALARHLDEPLGMLQVLLEEATHRRPGTLRPGQRAWMRGTQEALAELIRQKAPPKETSHG